MVSMRALRIVVVAALVVGSLAGMSYNVIADPGGSVRPDGTVDLSKEPRTVPALNCEGEIVAQIPNPLLHPEVEWTPPAPRSGKPCSGTLERLAGPAGSAG